MQTAPRFAISTPSDNHSLLFPCPQCMYTIPPNGPSPIGTTRYPGTRPIFGEPYEISVTCIPARFSVLTILRLRGLLLSYAKTLAGSRVGEFCEKTAIARKNNVNSIGTYYLLSALVLTCPVPARREPELIASTI